MSTNSVSVDVLCEHVISGKCKNKQDCPAGKYNKVGIGSCTKTGKGLAYNYSCNHHGNVLLLADKIDNPNYLFAKKKERSD